MDRAPKSNDLDRFNCSWTTKTNKTVFGPCGIASRLDLQIDTIIDPKIWIRTVPNVNFEIDSRVHFRINLRIDSRISSLIKVGINLSSLKSYHHPVCFKINVQVNLVIKRIQSLRSSKMILELLLILILDLVLDSIRQLFLKSTLELVFRNGSVIIFQDLV